MPVKTYDKGKIINRRDPSDFIYIHYIPPQFNETVSAQYNEQNDIIGRSAPYIYYSSTDARTLQIELHFFAIEDAEEEVKKRIDWLKSFCYPDYSSAVMKPPKMLKLILGKNFINWIGVIQECSPQYQAPYDIKTGLPMYATVDFNFKEVVTVPRSYDYFKPSVLKRVDRKVF